MKSFFIENDLKVLLNWLGINYKSALKKRIIYSIVITLVMFLLGTLLHSIVIIFLSIIIGLGYYKYQYYEIRLKKEKQKTIKKRMFPSFIKKLLILIKTNNIYQTLNKLVTYTDDPIKKHLITLIKDIDYDKSIKPYLSFAQNMEFPEAYQIMIVIYTFTEHLMEKEHLKSLEKMISNLYENEMEEYIEKKKRFLWLIPNISIITMLILVFALAIFMFANIFNEVRF